MGAGGGFGRLHPSRTLSPHIFPHFFAAAAVCVGRNPPAAASPRKIQARWVYNVMLCQVRRSVRSAASISPPNTHTHFFFSTHTGGESRRRAHFRRAHSTTFFFCTPAENERKNDRTPPNLANARPTGCHNIHYRYFSLRIMLAAGGCFRFFGASVRSAPHI